MAGLFNHILVPVDDSPRGDDGLLVAGQLARRLGASLLVLHVERRLVSTDEVIRDDEHFAYRVQALREQGLDAHYTLAYDRPDEAIREVATSERADLIVMAPHHRDHLALPHHSGVTEHTLADAPAPILVWPDEEPSTSFSSFLNIPSSVILVPVDGSALAEEVIPYAVWFAREYSRPIALVRVVSQTTWEGVGVRARQVELQRRFDDLRASQHYLASLRRRVAQQQAVQVQSMLMNGDPAEELVRLATTHEGGLIIMGTHGHTGFRRLLLGSVTAAVMRETPLPLLVIPPAAHSTQMTSATAQERQPIAAM